ncbi:ankyrin repeat and SOCS box protein 9 [Mesocricetus auratus]|uniref:Ankyrin repeat and SOCS box protein 9 n=1 Tax=Mesocricetus auratus TaxID=10036 RepID=A0ABM2XA85_MESAU|nr:ankyrin repeat and SOCS box protein 9 [Mesocricetus auratus]XP_040599750.1 ankyrin repeat and SOCS box protein 9 [Mesocricetus auratus]
MDGLRRSRIARLASCPHLRLFSNPLVGDIVSDWSPLHDAASHGRLLTLRNLINQGWPVNLITADHVSPLHEACLRGHLSCANILLSHGAQVNSMAVDWRTPLFNACLGGNHECVTLLLEYGAAPHPECALASPIHEAAKRGHVKCIESLATYGANIDYCINNLGTPLYMACENHQLACAKKLLELGACVNKGKGFESPLHVAARLCYGELAYLLMNFGANTHAKNAEGKRPVDLVPPENPLTEFFLEREGPQSLMQLCRLRIRKCFGVRQHHKISGLFLPEGLKRFLLHI